MSGYEKPSVTTLDSREVLAMLGPAQGMASGAVGTQPYPEIDTQSRGSGVFERR